MYHSQQGGPPYDYSSYSAPPLEQQGRTSAVRSNPQNPQNPTLQTSPYAPYTSYNAQPWQQSAGSWTPSQYTQSFTPEMSFSARPEAPTSVSPSETRNVPSGSSNIPKESRHEAGQSSISSQTSSPPRKTSIPTSAGTPPHGLDFPKMQESYHSIVHSADTLLRGGALKHRPLPDDVMDRMLHLARYGAQVLQSTNSRSNPDFRSTTGVADKDASASKRQKSDEHGQEGQTCLGCKATSTPEWRRGPLGPRTLCNACGLVYAKLLKKRARDARTHAGDNVGQGSQPAMDESGMVSSGASEDEDSYGSQERRSDLGDHGRRG